MAFNYLQVRREGAVEHLTLNRPDVRNAFNDEVIAELTAWARAARARIGRCGRSCWRARARCSAPAPMPTGWRAWSATRTRRTSSDARRMAEMFDALDTLPAAVIGRIHGAALGGGAGLAAICDIAVAEDAAVFGFTETKLGILPAVISPYVLPKIGPSAARELFLTGMRFRRRARERDWTRPRGRRRPPTSTRRSSATSTKSSAPRRAEWRRRRR